MSNYNDNYAKNLPLLFIYSPPLSNSVFRRCKKKMLIDISGSNDDAKS